jgi:hypothetical protein
MTRSVHSLSRRAKAQDACGLKPHQCAAARNTSPLRTYNNDQAACSRMPAIISHPML